MVMAGLAWFAGGVAAIVKQGFQRAGPFEGRRQRRNPVRWRDPASIAAVMGDEDGERDGAEVELMGPMKDA